MTTKKKAITIPFPREVEQPDPACISVLSYAANRERITAFAPSFRRTLTDAMPHGATWAIVIDGPANETTARVNIDATDADLARLAKACGRYPISALDLMTRSPRPVSGVEQRRMLDRLDSAGVSW